MPRANRNILPGYLYHLTRRCHNRSFLLRFALDRNAYYQRLRIAARQFQISILNYSITSYVRERETHYGRDNHRKGTGRERI